MFTRLRWPLVASALYCCLGCGSPSQSPLNYEFADNSQVGNWPEISRPILLVADNQTQHLYNDPFVMRSRIGINLSGASVQLDLYGQDLLRWVIGYDSKGNHTPIIHLGDGLNFSCAVEMERFFETMDRATQGHVPWVMAPGKNDGYFFGLRPAVRGESRVPSTSI